MPPTELIPHSRQGSQRKPTGNFVQKTRASTTVPIEAEVEIVDNIQKPVNVISLDKNCLNCSTGTQNEAVMKAYKMACLQYEPSPVEFENS